MKQRSSKLEKSFVKAATELHRRRLWRRFENEALFLVRVPTEELPLVVSILGAGGGEFGLSMLRGPRAFGLFRDLILDEGQSRHFADAGDSLIVSFDPWGEVPDELRALTLAAGPAPRRDKRVPVTFTSRPYEIAQPAGRADLRTLLWATRAILVADDAGEFAPFDLERRRRRIFELEVRGSLSRPEVTARIVDWPDSTSDVPPLAILPTDLEALDRLDERWLLGHVAMPPLEDEDDRLTMGFFVGVDAGPILNLKLGVGDDLEPGIEGLVEACRTGGPEDHPAGLPRQILFGHRRLFESLAPALAALGIEAECRPDDPSFGPFFEGLNQMLGRLVEADELEPDPGTREFWSQHLGEVVRRMLGQVESEGLVTERATKRFFGSLEQAEAACEELPEAAPRIIFLDWFMGDYRATKRSKTLLEKALAAWQLDLHERKLLEARRDASLSFFRVLSREPGVELVVEDILTGEQLCLFDPNLSSCELEGAFLPLRVLAVGGCLLPMLAGPPMAPLEVDEALDLLRARKVELSHAGLRARSEELGGLWQLVLDSKPPVLFNTDGEEIELISASFHVASPGAMTRAFEVREDLEYDEVEGSWSWLRPGGPGGLGAATLLGTLTLLDDTLLVEANSFARFERLRAWLEELEGIRFESFTPHSLDGAERPLDDRLPGAPPEQFPPEVMAAIQQMMLEQHLRWLDESIPALGGKTPREACKTEAGRRDVALLIRTMPDSMTPSGPIEAPREQLLRELGLGE